MTTNPTCETCTFYRAKTDDAKLKVAAARAAAGMLAAVPATKNEGECYGLPPQLAVAAAPQGIATVWGVPTVAADRPACGLHPDYRSRAYVPTVAGTTPVL